MTVVAVIAARRRVAGDGGLAVGLGALRLGAAGLRSRWKPKVSTRRRNIGITRPYVKQFTNAQTPIDGCGGDSGLDGIKRLPQNPAFGAVFAKPLDALVGLMIILRIPYRLGATPGEHACGHPSSWPLRGFSVATM
jgi:hypothetical protein